MKSQHKRNARQERRGDRRIQGGFQQENHSTLQAFEAQVEHQMSRIVFGPLQARNETQGQMICSMTDKRVTFAVGPAGTGKTFVSTSFAAELLEKGDIERIVITRPMVGCEEEMGFLPGDEYEKFAPWLGPFLDVLEGKLGKKKVETYLKFGKIIAKPLMMMRGATFRNSFVILDEAQNTTPGQMKMFLTRLGEGSRVVIDGDPEQDDLKIESGLVDAMRRFASSRSFGVIEFTEDDIVRDPMIREIVKAYRS